jgi:hypothetical protein
MAQTRTIKLLTASSNTGPSFDLYSDADNYVTAFETGVTKTSLTSTNGYTSTGLIPDAATVIIVKSTGTCTNYIDVTITGTSYDLTVGSFANAASACAAVASTVTLFARESTSTVVTTFYTNRQCTFPYVGNSTFYKFKKTGVTGNYSANISSIGVVTNIAVCP